MDLLGLWENPQSIVELQRCYPFFLIPKEITGSMQCYNSTILYESIQILISTAYWPSCYISLIQNRVRQKQERRQVVKIVFLNTLCKRSKRGILASLCISPCPMQNMQYVLYSEKKVLPKIFLVVYSLWQPVLCATWLMLTTTVRLVNMDETFLLF